MTLQRSLAPRGGDDAALLPPERAFKAGIDIARINVAAMCAGMLRAGLDIAVAATAAKSAFGQKLADFQGLRWQLADVATNAHAARLMAYDAATALDRGKNATVAAAHHDDRRARTLDGVVEAVDRPQARGELKLLRLWLLRHRRREAIMRGCSSV